MKASAQPTAPTPAAQSNQAEKKTITLTFEGKDLDLHGLLTKDADEAERNTATNVLRFVRKHYKTGMAD